LRRFLNPEARYDVWERRPYREFEKKVLVVGGGFGGYAVVQSCASAFATATTWAS
jgi:NADH dehydrogenase